MLPNLVLFHIKNRNLEKVQNAMAELTKTALTIQGKPRAECENGNHFYIALIKVKDKKDIKKLEQIEAMAC